MGSSADRSTFLTNSTRDVTLTKETKISFLVKEKITNRKVTYNCVFGPVSNNFRTLNNFLLAEYISTRITVEDLENLTLTGTLDTNIDGVLAQLGDFNTQAKTNFTLPCQKYGRQVKIVLMKHYQLLMQLTLTFDVE